MPGPKSTQRYADFDAHFKGHRPKLSAGHSSLRDAVGRASNSCFRPTGLRARAGPGDHPGEGPGRKRPGPIRPFRERDTKKPGRGASAPACVTSARRAWRCSARQASRRCDWRQTREVRTATPSPERSGSPALRPVRTMMIDASGPFTSGPAPLVQSWSVAVSLRPVARRLPPSRRLPGSRRRPPGQRLGLKCAVS